MKIRGVEREDVPQIQDILLSCGNFRQCEIDIALELVRMRLLGSKDYIVRVAVDDRNRVWGYVCYGLDSLTVGTYNLYWIAVHPDVQGKGIGKFLMDYVENDVRDMGGRLIVIETSSTEKYEKTRKFYEKIGYNSVARIKDYYLPGDDKIIFIKGLQ